jgi:hypothetical protein
LLHSSSKPNQPSSHLYRNITTTIHTFLQYSFVTRQTNNQYNLTIQTNYGSRVLRFAYCIHMEFPT